MRPKHVLSGAVKQDKSQAVQAFAGVAARSVRRAIGAGVLLSSVMHVRSLLLRAESLG